MNEFPGRYRPQSLQPFYTEERCHIVERMNTQRCDEVSLAECRVAPGVTTQLHQLSIAERYVIQEGTGIMELQGNQVFSVTPGDCVLIPPGCPQRIKNVGEADLVFLCVCTPRFLPEHYTVLEDARTKEIALP